MALIAPITPTSRGTTSEGALPAHLQAAPPRGSLSARRSALAERCAVVSVTACPRLAGGAVTVGAG